MPKPLDLASERFASLLSRHLDRAYRLAGLILGNSAEAEDVVHDAAIRAWRASDSLRDPDSFDAWFDRIVVNACRDRIRRSRRIRFIPFEPLHEADGNSFDPFAAVFDRDDALRAVCLLDPHERAVVVLHYWADLPLAAVADRLGWPVGTVKTRLHRALESMRAGIGAPEGGKVAAR